MRSFKGYLLLYCLFLICTVKAQNNSERSSIDRKMEIYALSGLGISNFFGEKDLAFEARTCYGSGLGYTYFLRSNKIGFNAEFLYENKECFRTDPTGPHSWNSSGPAINNITFTLDYLTIPLSIKLNLGQNENVFFQLGACWAYLINKQEVGYEYTPTVWNYSEIAGTASLGFRKELKSSFSVAMFLRAYRSMNSTSSNKKILQEKGGIYISLAKYI